MTKLFVGVLGYSAKPFDVKEGKRLLNLLLDQVRDDHPGAEIVIVSGYTDMGVPALAYRIAKERGWRTMGIACHKAEEKEVDASGKEKFKHLLYPVDEKELVGQDWHEASGAFVKKCDVAVRVGGGVIALDEIKAFKARGVKVYERELAELRA